MTCEQLIVEIIKEANLDGGASDYCVYHDSKYKQLQLQTIVDMLFP